ncbi:MAG: hypothetical protein IJ799_06175, partial [Bacteroidales bacterium]|nr:hypothetical protein [Bacteroidales bacterium]
MKKYISIILAVAALSCSRNWNDLVHEEVVAEITEFGVEGQVSSVINKLERTATVEMPSGSDLGNLAVSAFACTEGALKSLDLQAGDVLDLNEPMTIVLTTYDEYTWTLRAVISEDEPAEPEKKLTRDGPQIYNMGFDLWSKHPDNKNVDMIYGDDATEEQKAVWVAGGGEL